MAIRDMLSGYRGEGEKTRAARLEKRRTKLLHKAQVHRSKAAGLKRRIARGRMRIHRMEDKANHYGAHAGRLEMKKARYIRG